MMGSYGHRLVIGPGGSGTSHRLEQWLAEADGRPVPLELRCTPAVPLPPDVIERLRVAAVTDGALVVAHDVHWLSDEMLVELVHAADHVDVWASRRPWPVTDLIRTLDDRLTRVRPAERLGPLSVDELAPVVAQRTGRAAASATVEASPTTVAPLDEEDDGDADDGDADEGEGGDDGSGPARDTTPSPTSEPGRPADQIVTDVEGRIQALALIPPQAAVDVVADQFGTVELNGFVDDDVIRREVVDAARSVDGVAEVSDQLDVRPPDERCTTAIRDRERWACLIDASLGENETIRATYVSDFAGDVPNVNGGFHYHLFGSQIEVDEGGVPGLGPWLVWDEEALEISTAFLFGTDPVPAKLCVRIAEADHSIDGESGNCRPIDPFAG